MTTKREAAAILKELEKMVSQELKDDTGRTVILQHDPDLHEGSDSDQRCPGCRALLLLQRLSSILQDHAGVIETEIERRSPGLMQEAAQVGRLQHEKEALQSQVEALPHFKAQVVLQKEYIDRLELQLELARQEIERLTPPEPVEATEQA